MQVFQNNIRATVELLASFSLIFTHLTCLYSGQDHLFFPVAVIMHDFLPFTNLPTAPIFHIIIFIKNGGKMFIGFVNIARLPSVCMPFSLHDSPVSFSLVEGTASSCHCLSIFRVSSSWRQNFLRRVMVLTVTCRFSISSALSYHAARGSSVKPFPFAKGPDRFCCSGIKKSGLSFVFKSLSPSTLLIFFSNYISYSFHFWLRMPFYKPMFYPSIYFKLQLSIDFFSLWP